MRVLALAFTILLFATVTMAQEQISFSAPDGFSLKGDLYGKGERGVVLVHGGRFTKESWKKQALTLADAGFRVLAIDFRGYGQTIAGTQTADDKKYPDTLAAVRYLHSAGVHSVAVVGASMGGDAAADADVEAHAGEINRVVFLASDGGEAPGRLQGKKLFIVSRNDEGSDGLRLPGIAKNYRRVLKPKKLVILDGSAHAQFIFDTSQGPRLMQEILRFLSEP
jgi:pimeloyl-ACP methyl ester carboxylesterase